MELPLTDRDNTTARPAAPRTPPNASIVVWWGAAAAIVAGLIEVAIVLAPRLFEHKLIFQSLQVLWMTPASYLVFILPGALLLAMAGRIAPRLFTPRVQLFLVFLPACFGLWWLAYPSLHRLAIVALTLGVTTQLSSIVDARRTRLEAALPRVVGALVAIVMLLGGALNISRAIRERSTLASLPAVDGERPNVLLLILDTVRAANLSLYGYGKRTTPELERWGSRGAVFREAYSTAPWTLASHAGMFTGHYPFEVSADWAEPLDRSHVTLAESFQRAGYVTGGFVANLMYTSEETGLDRGFAHYEDWPISFTRVLENSSLGFFLVNSPKVRDLIGFHDNWSRKRAGRISDDFLDWQRRQETSRPFFAFLNYFDAHEPYLPPPPFDTAFGRLLPGRERLISHGRRADGMRPQKRTMDPTDSASEEAAYDASIASMDRVIGAMLDSLDRRGTLRRTIVVVTSDHGELFGEHGLHTHGNSLYQPLLHVPLVVVYPPRVPAGLTIDRPVSLRDLGATLLDLAGIDRGRFPGASFAPQGAAGVPNVPLSPLVSEIWPPPNQPDWFPISRGYMRAFAEPPYFYIRNGDGKEELYRRDVDPGERTNLATSTPVDSALLRARRVIDSLPKVRRYNLLPPPVR